MRTPRFWSNKEIKLSPNCTRSSSRACLFPQVRFELEIPGDPDGLQLAAQAVVVGRGDEEKVIVRRVPLVRGQLVLDGDEPLKISLHRGGKQVASVSLPSVGRIELPVGDYDVRLIDQPELLRAFPGRVTIDAGAEIKVRIRPVGELHNIVEPGGAINSLAVDAEGKRVFAGVADRAPVGLWSLPLGKEAFYATQHKSAVTAVAISSDGKLALSGGGEKGPSPDTALRLWDIARGAVLGKLEGSKQIVACIAFAKSAGIAFSGAGNTVTVWDLQEMKPLRSWVAHDTAIHCLAVLPDGKRLITGGGNGEIHLWDVDTETKLRSFCRSCRFCSQRFDFCRRHSIGVRELGRHRTLVGCRQRQRVALLQGPSGLG